MEKGIVYLMETSTDGLVKIGQTEEKQFRERMRELESNGYKCVGTLRRSFAILVDDYKTKEKLLHKVFAKSRVGKTEFFAVDPNLVKQLMASMDGKVIYPTGESKKEIYEVASDIVQSSDLPDGLYTYSKKGEKYHGTLKVDNGVLVLLKNSVLSPVCGVMLKNQKRKRDELNLKDDSILLEDTIMESVSLASALIAGNNRNGWDCWLNNKGQKIDIYRQNKE